MTRVLAFPRVYTAEELSQADGLLGGLEAPAPPPRGESAGGHVDAILRTRKLSSKTPRNPVRTYGAGRSKAIRDVFRALGWAKFFRVTKGSYTLGPRIEWAKDYAARWRWECDEQSARRRAANEAPRYEPPPVCGCVTCRYREAQRRAVERRVHYVLNLAFREDGGREFGDRSDTLTDYFDADYTFHA